MAMNCTDLEAEWARREISRPDPWHLATGAEVAWSTAAEEHFALCASCRRRRAAEALLDRAICDWRTTPLPDFDVTATLERMHDSRLPIVGEAVAQSTNTPRRAAERLERAPATPRRRSLSAAPVLLTALATAVCVVALISSDGGRRETRVATGSPQNAGGESAGNSVPVTETMALFWRDVRSQSAAAARTTVASFERLPTISAAALPTEAPLNPIEPNLTADITIPATAEPRVQWPGWSQPLGQQVGNAFRFLGTALPAEAPPAS